jgi:hypothetical protein
MKIHRAIVTGVLLAGALGLMFDEGLGVRPMHSKLFIGTPARPHAAMPNP